MKVGTSGSSGERRSAASAIALSWPPRIRPSTGGMPPISIWTLLPMTPTDGRTAAGIGHMHERVPVSDWNSSAARCGLEPTP